MKTKKWQLNFDVVKMKNATMPFTGGQIDQSIDLIYTDTLWSYNSLLGQLFQHSSGRSYIGDGIQVLLVRGELDNKGVKISKCHPAVKIRGIEVTCVQLLSVEEKTDRKTDT